MKRERRKKKTAEFSFYMLRFNSVVPNLHEWLKRWHKFIFVCYLMFVSVYFLFASLPSLFCRFLLIFPFCAFNMEYGILSLSRINSLIYYAHPGCWQGMMRERESKRERVGWMVKNRIIRENASNNGYVIIFFHLPSMFRIRLIPE